MRLGLWLLIIGSIGWIGQSAGAVKSDTTTLQSNNHFNGMVSQMIYRNIAVAPRNREKEQIAAQRETRYFEQFKGKTIGEIRIERQPVFDTSTRVWMERQANAVHFTTQEKRIRRDLFIHSGDRFDPLLVMNNRQLLRSRSYLSQAEIAVIPVTPDSSIVDLIVTTRDNWSIGIDLNSRSNGNTFLELYDDNILGWGSKLSVTTYFNIKNWNYGGNQLLYENQNLFGTFFAGRLIAGKGFDQSDYGGEMRKEFIKPADYAGGGYFYYRRTPIYILPMDSTYQTSSQKWGAWFGRSFAWPKANNSIFFTTHFQRRYYRDRPNEVDESTNPYFHHENLWLTSIGVYRERFRTANLIYGYGVEEDVAYGYQLSLYGGPSWGEFGNRWYVGTMFNAGQYTSIGYFRWEVALGSYVNAQNGCFYRAALSSNVNWFSPLWGSGRYKVRQFIDLNFTRGWNRQEGYREYVEFENPADLRGLRENIYGNNRLVLNAETVIFTPWHLYQFKMALYTFADMGLLGDEANLFRNRFYSTLGIGLRIKNERLIFRTINIRLGIAVSGKGWMNADYFHLNTEDKRKPIRYTPTKATVVDYGMEYPYYGGDWE